MTYKYFKGVAFAAALFTIGLTTAAGAENGNSPAAAPAATQNVEVVNTPSVKDADNPARQPFHYTGSVNMGYNTWYQSFTIPVPAGKRLVIEQVSAYVTTAIVGVIPSAYVLATTGGVDAYAALPLAYGGEYSDKLYLGTQSVRLYADPLTNVVMKLTRSRDLNGGFNGVTSGTMTISGYLVTLP
jgi:hypothetical protein